MPFYHRFCESLFRASLHLLVVVISFTTMAIPVITQEFSRSSNATTTVTTTTTTTNTVWPTNNEIVDVVIPLLIFALFFYCLGLVGGFCSPPSVLINRMATTFGPIWDTVSHFRFGALLRRRADAVVDPDGARPAPQTHDDDTSPTPPVPSSSHRPPAEDVELGALPAADPCASSASDDGGLTSPSSA